MTMLDDPSLTLMNAALKSPVFAASDDLLGELLAGTTELVEAMNLDAARWAS